MTQTETNAMKALAAAEASIQDAEAHGEATYNSLEEIRVLVAWTFQKLSEALPDRPFAHVPRLVMEGRAVTVKWNRRAIGRLGQAKASVDYLEINLSAKLWPRIPVAERADTIVHEACHLAAFVLYGPGVGHGPRWKALMRICNRQPNRCGHVYNGDLRKARARTTVPASCGCGTVTELGIRRANKVRRGQARYTCRRCRQVVKLAS